MYAKGRMKGTAKFAIKPTGAPKAVELVGDFTNWRPVSMKKQKDGQFLVELPLTQGSWEYKFIIDGQWKVDPDNSAWAANPFGTMNSVARL